MAGIDFCGRRIVCHLRGLERLVRRPRLRGQDEDLILPTTKLASQAPQDGVPKLGCSLARIVVTEHTKLSQNGFLVFPFV